MKDIILESSETNRNGIQKYFIRNKIDINVTTISNHVNVIDSGFGKTGFINKLFNIFRHNKFFCLKEQRQELCGICGLLKI